MRIRLNLEGQRYGRWTAIALVGRQGSNGLWLCRCECGTERPVSALNLRSGASQSCGCLRSERSASAHTKHGLVGTPEYRAWVHARKRCDDTGDNSYHNYGGRGIRVCEEWRNDFAAFIGDMGQRPSPRHSLDRIDNERGYEPGNCRWADRSTQARNTRRNRWIVIDGERRLLTDWSELSGIGHTTIIWRLRAGWPPKRAVFEQSRLSA